MSPDEARRGFDSRQGHVTNKHSREDTVTRNEDGDVVNVRGTITDVPERNTRQPNPPKHAKR